MSLTSDVIRRRLLARARLRHWEGFSRVAELGSVRKAAEAMGLAQPALSSLLGDLESLLGTPLFERHARGMRLTSSGRELLHAARSLLAASDRAAELAVALQSGAGGVVRVGAIGGAVTGLLTVALPRVARMHPGLLVQVNEWDAPQLDQRMAHGDIDIALCRAPSVVPQGWRFESLLPDRFAVLAGPSHPLVGRRCTLAQLRAATWLAMPTGSAARAAFDALFAEGGPQPALCQISHRVPTLLWAMLQDQPLLALLPLSVARQLLDAGELVELPTPRPLPFEAIGALVRTEDAPAGADTLLQVLRDAGAQAGAPGVKLGRPRPARA